MAMLAYVLPLLLSFISFQFHFSTLCDFPYSFSFFLQAVLVVLSIKQQPHCLRVGQNTEQPSLVEDAGSRNDIPSHEARNLTLEIRDHEAVDNERCCEPPPYSADRNDAEQPDCQPLLQ